MIKKNENAQSADFKIDAFDKTLRNMKCVKSFTRDGRLYHVSREVGKMIIAYLAVEPLICDRGTTYADMYTVGQNDVVEICDRCVGSGHQIDCIVTLSDYSAYTLNAKNAAESFYVRLLTAQEFFECLVNPSWP